MACTCSSPTGPAPASSGSGSGAAFWSFSSHGRRRCCFCDPLITSDQQNGYLPSLVCGSALTMLSVLIASSGCGALGSAKNESRWASGSRAAQTRSHLGPPANMPPRPFFFLDSPFLSSHPHGGASAASVKDAVSASAAALDTRSMPNASSTWLAVALRAGSRTNMVSRSVCSAAGYVEDAGTAVPSPLRIRVAEPSANGWAQKAIV